MLEALGYVRLMHEMRIQICPLMAEDVTYPALMDVIVGDMVQAQTLLGPGIGRRQAKHIIGKRISGDVPSRLVTEIGLTVFCTGNWTSQAAS